MATKKCNKCGEVKSQSKFDLKRGVPIGYCKDCRRMQIRDHYNENRQYYIDKARRRTNRIIAENRKKLVEYLQSHPCVDCGESDIIFLEFDHVRGEKEDAVANLIKNGCSWKKIQDEINKCDVRCVKCHRLRTYKEINWWGFEYIDTYEF